MKLETGDFCPLIKDKCKQTSCMWFMQVRGVHPQTGALVDEWDCAMRWQIVLLLENTQATRGTQAATESMRNEAKKAHDENLSMGAIAVHRSQETFKALVENNDQKKLT